MPDAFAAADEAAAVLARRSSTARHDVAVVMGSGWDTCLDVVGPGEDVAMAVLPGFPAPSVTGHRGVVRSVDLDGRAVLVLAGRAHLYEGHDPSTVVHGIRTAAAAGCRTVVLTNGAGSLQPAWSPGQPVLISDHLNLTGRSPLTGPVPPLGERFVDLTDLYSQPLRDLARTVDPDLSEGVYLGLPGPHFETPAEIRMARAVGADLVGMSTVLEAIAARQCGLDVLGISLVTNLAAGVGTTPIDADDILSAGVTAGDRLGTLLRAVVERIVR